MCTTATLRVVGGDEQGAVGNWAIPILFVNDGQAACHLYGYPGVSWITATGSQIGPAAVRETSVSPQLVTLQPEQAAVAVVLQPSRANQVASGCAVTQAAAITVYPPGNTAAATVTTGGRNWAAGLNWCSNGKAEATVNPVSVFQGRIPAAAPSCQPGQLSFALARDLGSLMQQPAAYFRFTSRSAQACSLYGYPGFELVDSSGQVISLRVRHGLSYQILDPGPQLVTLPPGATAYFGFGWADVNRPGRQRRLRDCRRRPGNAARHLPAARRRLASQLAGVRKDGRGAHGRGPRSRIHPVHPIAGSALSIRPTAKRRRLTSPA